jgi:hypothetical protein
MQAVLRIMHGDVKVGESGMSFGVHKNVVGLDVTTGY